MTAMAADCNLLFGLLALQNGLIDQVQLVAAFQAWTLDKFRDLADHLTANGHVNDYRPLVPFAMPTQLLAGGPEGRLGEVSDRARGLAAGDLDNDGLVDLLLVAQDASLACLHNRTGAGNAVSFRLEGTASNRDAVGARVEIAAGDRRQTTWRVGGGSYLSASDARLHFGLRGCDRVERGEIRWPSGRVDRHRDLPADRGYVVTQGEGLRTSPGSQRR
jgi:hypothetical protein